MATFSDDLTVGRGRLYFDRFLKGSKTKTGELYFGNCDALTISTQSETLDHYSSTGGMKVKDASVTISVDRSGSFSLDNISWENLALAYSGDVGSTSHATATNQIYATKARKGRFIQIGATDNEVTGVRNISNVTVGIGTNPLSLISVSSTDSWEFDPESGRLYFEPDAVGVSEGDNIIIKYNITASTRDTVVSGNDPVFGALRFVEDNGVGTNREYYFPYVKLASDGDFSLIGDEWRKLEFTYSALKLNTSTADLYIDGRPE